MAEKEPVLVSPRGSKNKYWAYFGFRVNADSKTEEKVECRLCSKTIYHHTLDILYIHSLFSDHSIIVNSLDIAHAYHSKCHCGNKTPQITCRPEKLLAQERLSLLGKSGMIH